jgi:hypothetical protein
MCTFLMHGFWHGRTELSDSRTVPLGGAESASVQVELGAGELKLEGGSPQLLDARFRYVGNAAKPEVRYDLTGSRGYLVLRQPPLQGIGFHDRDFWDLRLNGRVPLDIYVNVGAGQGTFKLGNTAVRRLDIQVGAGELNLDLNGKWEQDLSARITGGVGQATVRLPRDAGVRVRARGGMGGIHVEGLRRHQDYFVNDAYGTAVPKLRLEITGGIGEIKLIG